MSLKGSTEFNTNQIKSLKKWLNSTFFCLSLHIHFGASNLDVSRGTALIGRTKTRLEYCFPDSIILITDKSTISVINLN